MNEKQKAVINLNISKQNRFLKILDLDIRVIFFYFSFMWKRVFERYVFEIQSISEVQNLIFKK